MPALTVLAGGEEYPIALPAEEGAQRPGLLQSIYLSGLFEPPPLCAGLALCGRCRVRFISEPPAPLPEDFKALGEALVERGWRLACRHKAEDGARLALPAEVKLLTGAGPDAVGQGAGLVSQKTVPPAAPLDASLAVDFGSTSLHYVAVRGNAATSPKIAVNPQIGAGSDIISRLAFARRSGGLTRLSGLSRAALARMAEEAGGASEIVLAANPAMVYLILEKDISGLAAAPYHLDYRGGSAASLPGLPPLWVAPLMGPFMGGDLSAGYAALAWGQQAEYPFVLADMGTNGEFILALSESEALAASLPLGPALEGIGMRCGSEARPGVVTGFALGSDGLLPQMYGSASPARGLTLMPQGLSGSAYLALAAHLLRQGLILPSGLFAEPPAQPTPLAARLWRALRQGDEGRAFYLSDNLFMSGADVEELLKIKAAFSLALRLLLKEAGLGFAGLKGVYLAGALGSYVDIGALEALGFLPPGGGGKARAAGNTSLLGAELLCRRPELRGPLVDWAGRVRVLSLTDAEDFQAEYTGEMRFAW